MPDEQEIEGIDPEPADSEREQGDAEPVVAAEAGGGETAEAEASDGVEEKDEAPILRINEARMTQSFSRNPRAEVFRHGSPFSDG